MFKPVLHRARSQKFRMSLDYLWEEEYFLSFSDCGGWWPKSQIRIDDLILINVLNDQLHEIRINELDILKKFMEAYRRHKD